MSAMPEEKKNVPARVRTQNSSFSAEKLQARQKYHLRKIENTLNRMSSTKLKTSRTGQVKKYFGIA